ncbi:MAG: tetratricopeptide repeat protein [Planctomycetia bacterium]|nr:tetratricopeptide repeat protein [Planctomycetia bacterium]
MATPPPRRRHPIDGSSFAEDPVPPARDVATNVPRPRAADQETLKPPPGAPPAPTDSAVLRSVTPPLPPEAAAAPDSARFGKFIRVRKLGQGGMGEVWQAWDVPLGRWVALKFLSGGDETEIARFTQEAHVAGKLSHPHITAVYEVGEAHGRHYIAMQYIEGTTAAKLPRGDRRALARVIRDAARAVAEAHRAGVVHRDLKPDNLLVRAGKASASAVGEHHVFVTDFGLARRMESVSGLSLSGAIIGTPAFMSPEQSRGETVDARADVYGLGATLYALATGEAPFRAASVFELLRAVQETDAPSMRALVPAVEADLDTIVLKCLEKDRARRYASADELADDLDRFLEGDPIAARPASLVYRVKRTLWKRRAVLAVAVVGIAATLGVMVPPLVRASRARAAKDRELRLWAALAGTMNEAELLRRAGAGAQARAKIDEGLATCRSFLQADELPVAHYFMGRLLADVGDGEGAERELTRALELDPALGEARLERGILLARRYLDAIGAARQDSFVAHGTRFDFDVPAFLAARPDLQDLAARAAADLSARVGQSSFFRESDRELGLALLSFARRDEADARARLEAVLQRDPASVDAALALMQVRFQARDWEGAIAVAGAAAAQDRTLTQPFTIIIDACHWLIYYNPDAPENEGHRKREVAAAEELRRRAGPENLDARLLAGFALADAGDHRAALAEFDAVLAADPGNARALAQRGSARVRLGDYAAAVGDLDRALELYPANFMCWYNRGSAKRLLGRPREAVEDFNRALELVPNWDVALNNRGLCRAELGEGAAAVADYTAAIEAGPERAMPLTNRAMQRIKDGRLPEARTDLDEAIRLRPGYFNAWWGRGELRWRMQDVAGAEADLTKALELRPDAVEPHFFRGLSRVELGKPDGAIEDLEACIAQDFRAAECWFGIGNARALKNDRPGAAAAFRKATELNPDALDAWRNLGQVLLESFRFADAIEPFTQALRLDPAAFDVLASRAFCRQSTKDWKGAEEDYSKALEIAPADWDGRPDVENRLKFVRGKLKPRK